jgi:hypothetical protein
MNAVFLHGFHFGPVYPSLRVGDINTMKLILCRDMDIEALICPVLWVFTGIVAQPLPGGGEKFEHVPIIKWRQHNEHQYNTNEAPVNVSGFCFLFVNRFLFGGSLRGGHGLKVANCKYLYLLLPHGIRHKHIWRDYTRWCRG